jgi:MFS transporter, SHS family, sialic acid transporter
MHEINKPATNARPVSLSRAQWLVLAAAFFGWMFDGLEQGILPLVGRPALQDWRTTGRSDSGWA